MTHQVLFSKEFVSSLLQVKDTRHRARVLQRLHRLAKGHWPLRLIPHNAVQPDYQDVLQVFQEEQLWLIWSVDADQSTGTQVIDDGA